MRRFLLAFLGVAAPVQAANVVLSDGEFPDVDWTVLDDEGAQIQVGRSVGDGNPGAYRRLLITYGAGGQTDIVNQSPTFLYDQGSLGAITGLSISYDVIRRDADPGEFYVSVGTVENGSFHQAFTGRAGVGWQHYSFECIHVDDLRLGSGPVQFAFAFSGYTPFTPLSPGWEIGIDNFRVQIQTAPDTCDGLSGELSLEGTDNDHQWSVNRGIPYLLTVTNTGGETLPGVQISDRVPVATSFVPADSSPGWTCTPDGNEDGTCTVTVGDLGPGESRTVTFAARVADGTPPGWDVFNELRADATGSALGVRAPLDVRVRQGGGAGRPVPRATVTAKCKDVCTAYKLATDSCTADAWCCAIAMLCEVFPSLATCKTCIEEQFQCSVQVSPALAPFAAGSPAVEPIRLGLLYRLRDRYLHGTPGGEEAIALYYRHSPAIAAALIANPALAATAIDTLRLWQPAIDELVQGSTPMVTAERLQALATFLDALRPVAPPTLAAAIDHGRRRLDLGSAEGTTLATLLERLDDLVCTRAATHPSVLCRLEDGEEVASSLPTGTLATKLASSLDRATTLASEAASAAAGGDKRGARRRVRAVAKLVGKIARQVRSKRAKRDLPAEARTQLTSLLSSVRADLKALAR